MDWYLRKISFILSEDFCKFRPPEFRQVLVATVHRVLLVLVISAVEEVGIWVDVTVPILCFHDIDDACPARRVDRVLYEDRSSHHLEQVKRKSYFLTRWHPELLVHWVWQC